MDELEEFEFRRRYEMEQKPSTKSISWADVPVEAVKSFVPSTASMIGDIVNAISSPVKTLSGVSDLWQSGLSTELKKALSRL